MSTKGKSTKSTPAPASAPADKQKKMPVKRQEEKWFRAALKTAYTNNEEAHKKEDGKSRQFPKKQKQAVRDMLFAFALYLAKRAKEATHLGPTKQSTIADQHVRVALIAESIDPDLIKRMIDHAEECLEKTEKNKDNHNRMDSEERHGTKSYPNADAVLRKVSGRVSPSAAIFLAAIIDVTAEVLMEACTEHLDEKHPALNQEVLRLALRTVREEFNFFVNVHPTWEQEIRNFPEDVVKNARNAKEQKRKSSGSSKGGAQKKQKASE